MVHSYFKLHIFYFPKNRPNGTPCEEMGGEFLVDCNSPIRTTTSDEKTISCNIFYYKKSHTSYENNNQMTDSHNTLSKGT